MGNPKKIKFRNGVTNQQAIARWIPGVGLYAFSKRPDWLHPQCILDTYNRLETAGFKQSYVWNGKPYNWVSIRVSGPRYSNNIPHILWLLSGEYT